ncbi:prostacyclin synthase-like isoform X2 [Micropterus dolomieu]|uniref:prostacyclin synthase-like isoform X1 n=1 Tax=Micropterus dolomieu TaxID=147949 RepID=UPI001E8E5C31|nr:prostacyclin synthase-like isoform X1 [Micropterus dolomieu]XP_045932141.1 prostacyclin synthase-like isoform X2 [Micropterus dolomieu]
MIWTIFLLIQVALLYFILTHRSRSKSDPPLDKGIIPWLGHALEFGKDASKFLNRMKLKHGNIFTVRAAGRYVTVLLDPHSYDTVINDSDSLDFTRYAQVLMERIFNLQLPHHQLAKAKAMMKKHFMGMNLAVLNSTLRRHLQGLLKAKMPQNQKDWKEEGLFSFSYSLLFKAGYLTLFGGEQNNNGTDPSSVYKEYKKFDDLLTKMARGTLKSEEKRTAQSVRHRLWELLAPAGLSDDSGSSPWIHAYRRLLQEEGADEETQKKAVLMQLWATQGNVGPAAFWLLGYLLTSPEALTAVKREMETSETSHLDRPVKTPVFDSALEETLRLTAAPFITREVVQEKTLHMADGQEYLLRKGDRVCLFPFNSPQMDPEIYQEPQKYKYDRFLNEDGSMKRDFYKGGRRLKYYTMPWGAGTNGCVGKHFAINTIRQFVYMVLANYDLELCDPNAQMPEVNASRYGFGMMQPEGDLLIRYKPRNTL